MSRRIRTVAVIGAQGRMGRLFKNLCYEAGVEVVEFDQPLESTALAAGFRLAELVLLAVPVKAVRAALNDIVPHMNRGQILADLCSVKMRPMEHMLAAYDGPVVGTHPLFGPQAGETLRVAVCPGRGDADEHLDVSLWLSELGLAPFMVSAEEHDRAVAYIQGLNYVTNASYLSATAGLQGIEHFVTPSFRRRLASAEKMLTEDAEMFEALFEANPFSQEAVRLFRSHLNLAASGDVNLLTDRAGWWWRKTEPGEA